LERALSYVLGIFRNPCIIFWKEHWVMCWKTSGIHTEFFWKSIELCAGKFQEYTEFFGKNIEYVLGNFKDPYRISWKEHWVMEKWYVVYLINTDCKI
jgi:hypothetical protein